MKGILIQKNKVVIPRPLTPPPTSYPLWIEEYRLIVAERLSGLNIPYEEVEVEYLDVELTPEEQEKLNKKFVARYVFYLVLTKNQLGSFTGIEGQELDDLYDSLRQNLNGTRCIYKVRETKQWYNDLSNPDKNRTYPKAHEYDAEGNQISTYTTIYEYLDANRSDWEEPSV